MHTVCRYPKKSVELTAARNSRSQRMYVKSMLAGRGGGATAINPQRWWEGTCPHTKVPSRERWEAGV